MTPIVPSRRRIWPWVLGICLAPVILLAAAAYSFLTLDRDGAILRREVMSASAAGWNTKVQISAGRFSLGMIRTALAFVHNDDLREAREALKAVGCASVGVYERKLEKAGGLSHERLIAETDRAMSRRGWSRLVGVVDKQSTVLVYGPRNFEASGAIDLCISVIDGRELVVVSATVNPEGLAKLIERHAGGEMPRGLRLAGN